MIQGRGKFYRFELNELYAKKRKKSQNRLNRFFDKRHFLPVYHTKVRKTPVVSVPVPVLSIYHTKNSQLCDLCLLFLDQKFNEVHFEYMFHVSISLFMHVLLLMMSSREYETDKMKAQSARPGAGSAAPPAGSLRASAAGDSPVVSGQKRRREKERAESVSPHGPRGASAWAAASAERAGHSAPSLNSSGISKWQLISLEVTRPTPLAPVRCRVQSTMIRGCRHARESVRDFMVHGGACVAYPLTPISCCASYRPRRSVTRR